MLPVRDKNINVIPGEQITPGSKCMWRGVESAVLLNNRTEPLYRTREVPSVRNQH